MAIVVNNPAETRSVESGSDAISWMLAVAVIIILALGAVYLLPRIANRAAAPAPAGANINVTLPSGNTGGTSGTTGGAGGTTGGTGGTTQ